MSNTLLEKLESNIDTTVENIELMRLQVEDLEQENASLESENMALRAKMNSWEETLKQMLSKLGSVNETDTDLEAESEEAVDEALELA